MELVIPGHNQLSAVGDVDTDVAGVLLSLLEKGKDHVRFTYSNDQILSTYYVPETSCDSCTSCEQNKDLVL